MKITLFRILAIIAMTVSLSAKRVDAQNSVCCPVSNPDSGLVDDRCNDYLKSTAIADEETAESWIDRVSNSLTKSNANSTVDIPLRAEPNSATPLEFESFETGTLPGNSASVSGVADKETGKQGKLKDSAALNATELPAKKIVILRADVSRDAEWSSHDTKPTSVAGVASNFAAIICEKGLRLNAPISHTVARRELLAERIESEIETSLEDLYQMALSMRRQIVVPSPMTASNTEPVEVADDLPSASVVAQSDVSAYDLYDAEPRYLFGCFGYESIYGNEPSLAEVIDQSKLHASTLTMDLVNPAKFDGYMPYDYQDSFQRQRKSIAAGNIKAKSVSFRKSKPKREPFISIHEFQHVPTLLERQVDMADEIVKSVDFAAISNQILGQLEEILCDSPSYQRWIDATWAIEVAIQVEAENRLAERLLAQRRLEAEKRRKAAAVSIAKSLKMVAERLDGASDQLLEFGENSENEENGESANSRIGGKSASHISR